MMQAKLNKLNRRILLTLYWCLFIIGPLPAYFFVYNLGNYRTAEYRTYLYLFIISPVILGVFYKFMNFISEKEKKILIILGLLIPIIEIYSLFGENLIPISSLIIRSAH